jgi:hypothetical protein
VRRHENDNRQSKIVEPQQLVGPAGSRHGSDDGSDNVVNASACDLEGTAIEPEADLAFALVDSHSDGIDQIAGPVQRPTADFDPKPILDDQVGAFLGELDCDAIASEQRGQDKLCAELPKLGPCAEAAKSPLLVSKPQDLRRLKLAQELVKRNPYRQGQLAARVRRIGAIKPPVQCGTRTDPRFVVEVPLREAARQRGK